MVNLVDDRLKLHEKLIKIVKETLSNPDDTMRVWFKRPGNVRMVYPCIVYSRRAIDTRSADNIRFFKNIPYEIIVMDTDSDSDLVNKILEEIPNTNLVNEYTNDDIYHYVIELPNGSLV